MSLRHKTTASGRATRRASSDAAFTEELGISAQVGYEDTITARQYDVSGGWEDEFALSTSRVQQYPAVAMDAAGNGIVVWESQEKSGNLIRARRFAPEEGVLPDRWHLEFVVNTTPDARNPAVAMDPSGNEIVVWCRGAAGAIVGRQYDAEAVAWSATDLVIGPGTWLLGSAVAMDDAGNALAVWCCPDVVRARWYDGGNKVWAATDFAVSTTSTDYYGAPAVAMNSQGDAIVAWVSRESGGGHAIRARRWDAASGSWSPSDSLFHLNGRNLRLQAELLQRVCLR